MPGVTDLAALAGPVFITMASGKTNIPTIAACLRMTSQTVSKRRRRLDRVWAEWGLARSPRRGRGGRQPPRTRVLSLT
jgi:hypothetical protein